MTLWRKARTEAAGAWRSVRYDLGQNEPDTGARTGLPAYRRHAGHPDVTSTGFHTFGGAVLTDGVRTSYGEQLVPRPRRLAAVSAFGVLAVVGAAGSYFAVVNGIGALAGEPPAGAEPYPLAAEGVRGSQGDLANSGLGRGTANAAGRAGPGGTGTAPTTRIITLPAGKAPGKAAPAGAEPAGTVPSGEPQPQPTTPSGTGTTPDGCCLNPPVPTPTAPVPTPHSPSATPSPTVSEPEDSESPEPSESPSSADPTASDDSGTDPGERRRHRRH
jgi:hypothetical protein